MLENLQHRNRLRVLIEGEYKVDARGEIEARAEVVCFMAQRWMAECEIYALLDSREKGERRLV